MTKRKPESRWDLLLRETFPEFPLGTATKVRMEALLQIAWAQGWDEGREEILRPGPSAGEKAP